MIRASFGAMLGSISAGNSMALSQSMPRSSMGQQVKYRATSVRARSTQGRTNKNLPPSAPHRDMSFNSLDAGGSYTGQVGGRPGESVYAMGSYVPRSGQKSASRSTVMPEDDGDRSGWTRDGLKTLDYLPPDTPVPASSTHPHVFERPLRLPAYTPERTRMARLRSTPGSASAGAAAAGGGVQFAGAEGGGGDAGKPPSRGSSVRARLGGQEPLPLTYLKVTSTPYGHESLKGRTGDGAITEDTTCSIDSPEWFQNEKVQKREGSRYEVERITEIKSPRRSVNDPMDDTSTSDAAPKWFHPELKDTLKPRPRAVGFKTVISELPKPVDGLSRTRSSVSYDAPEWLKLQHLPKPQTANVPWGNPEDNRQDIFKPKPKASHISTVF